MHRVQLNNTRVLTLTQWELGHQQLNHTLPICRSGDFYGSEKSVTINGATNVKIEFVAENGEVTLLKEHLPLLDKEMIDASVMSKSALVEFFATETEKAKSEDVLLSLHLKATMMKVSDPIMFGHAVKVFYKDVFAKHGATFEQLGVDANNGIGDVYAKIGRLSAEKKAEIEADIQAVYATRPELAMVDSDKGITNLHVPSDVIIDASMPAALACFRYDVGTRRKAKRYQVYDP